ncbi:MAG: glycosyltransferase [Verrucomicrobia bacterium]|nr:glycosyltransferase [Verrucomicrobiota bacterium]
MPQLSLTFSLAEQSFSWTRSIGLLNLSMGMLEHVARRPEVGKVTLLSNDTFAGALNLPANVETLIHNEANGRGLSRMFWDQWKVYSAAKDAGNEWLFMPKGFVSFLRKCPVKLTAYVPDVVFDHYERNYPGKFSKLEVLYLKQSIKAALRQSKVIFTCSEFTNSELTRVAQKWGITPPPLVAIGTGFTRKLKLDVPKDDRIVVLASPFAHKRTDLALKYLERWCKETSFQGRVDWVGGFEKGVSLPKLPNWQLHQRVPEKEFREMVARARALVYFTEYEGFGMPPVEAIIAGTCSVYSDIPCTFEVMQGMGAPFKNESYESFAQALETAMKTSPEQLDAWTNKLLERHNWDVGAEKIVKALLAAK